MTDGKPDDHRSFIAKVLAMAASAPGFTAVAAVFGISVLIVTLSRFGVSLLTVALGIIGTLLLSTLYLAFSWIRHIHKPHKSRLAIVFAYTTVFIIIVSTSFLFTSLFFDAPLPIKSYIVKKINENVDPHVPPAFNEVKAFDGIEIGTDLSFVLEKFGQPNSTSMEAGGFRVSNYYFPSYDISIVYDRGRKIMQYGVLIKISDFKPEIRQLQGVLGRRVKVGDQPFGAIDPETLNPIYLSSLSSDTEPFEYYELLNDNPTTDVAIRLEYIKPRLDVPKSAVASPQVFERLVVTIQELGCHYGVPPDGRGVFDKDEFDALEKWRSTVSPNAFTIQRRLEDDEVKPYTEHVAAERLCEKT